MVDMGSVPNQYFISGSKRPNSAAIRDFPYGKNLTATDDHSIYVNNARHTKENNASWRLNESTGPVNC